MIKDIFNKTEDSNNKDDLIKISSLLIYAAKIDENYSDKEKNIIRNFLNSINANINSDEIIKLAEKEEQNSNQILNFTQEIKKNSLDFKKKNNRDIMANNFIR